MEDDFRSKAISCAKVACLEKSLPLGLCYKLHASLSVSFGFFVFFLSLKGIAEIFSTSISLSQGGGHAQTCLSSWCRRGHWDLTEQESLELGTGPSSGPGVTAQSPRRSCDQTSFCLRGLPNPIRVTEDSSVMAFH